MGSDGTWYEWRPYVPASQRRRNAGRRMRELRKQGDAVSPVLIEGRTIARTFWGKAWCTNLERYSDFSNRLPRGRTYVRNGAVLDLRIAPGEVGALVSGTEVYRVAVEVAAVPKRRWASICSDCAGAIDSLVELLQGRFSDAVMERLCRQETGLFPAPREIRFSCSCPDWASMCKHVAAVLYGIGARLDEHPELLFQLRKVQERDLITRAGSAMPLTGRDPPAGKVLRGQALSELFGLEIAAAEDGAADDAAAHDADERRRAGAASRGKAGSAAAARGAAAHAGSRGGRVSATPGHAGSTRRAERGMTTRKKRTATNKTTRKKTTTTKKRATKTKATTTKATTRAKRKKAPHRSATGARGAQRKRPTGAAGKAKLEAMIVEAIVDANGESEQRMGLYTMLEDNLALPFETEVLGVRVTVERVHLTAAEEIVAVCRRGSKRQRISILELPLPAPPPAGAEWIEAYRRWARGI